MRSLLISHALELSACCWPVRSCHAAGLPQAFASSFTSPATRPQPAEPGGRAPSVDESLWRGAARSGCWSLEAERSRWALLPELPRADRAARSSPGPWATAWPGTAPATWPRPRWAFVCFSAEAESSAALLSRAFTSSWFRQQPWAARGPRRKANAEIFLTSV